MFQGEWVLDAIRSVRFRTVRLRSVALGLSAEYIRSACRSERCAVDEASGVPPDCTVAAGIGDTLGSCAAQPPSSDANASVHARRVRRGSVDSLNSVTKPVPSTTLRFEARQGSELGNSARITRLETWPTTHPSTGSAEEPAVGWPAGLLQAATATRARRSGEFGVLVAMSSEAIASKPSTARVATGRAAPLGWPIGGSEPQADQRHPPM